VEQAGRPVRAVTRPDHYRADAGGRVVEATLARAGQRDETSAAARHLFGDDSDGRLVTLESYVGGSLRTRQPTKYNEHGDVSEVADNDGVSGETCERRLREHRFIDDRFRLRA
jgi:hypothetical protein